ncbi:MAG: 50S ribosomal protein L15 [Nitrospiria bacterium]
MKISDLAPSDGSNKKRRRIGRGPGSGQGKTAGKGHKGQAARSGGTKAPWFEGGQQPLTRRVPKRGFKNIFKKTYQLVNIGQLERFDSDTVVSPQLLRESGVVKNTRRQIKILSDGALTKPLVVSAHQFSRKATEKITAAGGRTEILS